MSAVGNQNLKRNYYYPLEILLEIYLLIFPLVVVLRKQSKGIGWAFFQKKDFCIWTMFKYSYQYIRREFL